ncbi:DNA polymerase alpha subunit A [Marchantia polymorpha subsp. ruderalis]|uniref:DNA polymerase n=2 Tax=Marchantia polymorpha TaxID=3197 RepID=A0AAF6BVX8_MARPO|nr:hypothetical protein MARPO_0074s0003 [Marchantia polymorpha]BBN16162.1 hypothetical protein Mp_7g03960 [Marchantia polymorpha subsp. ruderalis]|eukprot:PTQ35005.1 hypothetical protein MARPO_0074s0003 [Marchantia polymorpha]
MSQNEGSRRRTCSNPQASARSSALQELLALKKNGGKRVDNFEVRLEDKVYDTLSEADYNLHISKRRQEAEEFVVDDDGLGYLEEEDDWELGRASDEEDDKSTKPKKPRDPKKVAPSKRATELAAAAALTGKRKVTSMFAAASNTGIGRRPTNENGAAHKSGISTDSIVDDILAGITVDELKQQRRRGSRAADGGGAVRRQAFRQPSYPSIPTASHHFVPSEPVSSFQPDRAPDRLETLQVRAGELEVIDDPPSVPDISCVVKSETVNSPEVDDFPSHQFEREQSPPKMGSNHVAEVSISSDDVVTAERVESKIRLNAKIVERPQTMEGASAAWHSIRDGSSEKVANAVMKKETADENLELVSGALPLDAEGKLSFYFLDAYEEAFGANPGTVYLFGKVKKGGEFVSCCVVVRNLQRSVFAVPASYVFSDTKLLELEIEAKLTKDVRRTAVNAKLQELAKELKQELAEKLLDLNVGRFSMVPVKRSYAFERPDVPVGEQYFMKLSYPFKDPPLPHDLHGVHFTSIFGSHSSALELLLIKRRIKGPCWMSITNPILCPSSSQVSWCKLEVSLESSKDLAVTPPGNAPMEIPKLVVAAINLKTVINHKQNINEIASASVVSCKYVKVDMPMPQAEWNTHEMLNHFSIVRKLDGGIFPVGFTSEVAHLNSKVGSNVLSHESSERALLNHLMLKLYQLDPDVLVGHNISGFDLDVLLHRLQACKVQSKMWSKIGRLRRSQMPRLGGNGNTFGSGAGPGAMACIAGRLLCDTYISSRELLRQTSYSLTELSRNQLGRERKELVPSDIPAMYGSSASLLELIESGETDAWLALGLMFHLSVLPLSRQLTNISGNLWSKTLQGNRAQRVEFLLLHEFYSRKFIVPDKLSIKERERLTSKRKLISDQDLPNAGDENNIDEETYVDAPQTGSGKRKKGAAYLGGLVLEPKKGLYDKYILLLDFNSLYPSIIQEYNVCFTTVDRPSDGSIPTLPSSEPPGVLPQVLKGLVDRRRQVKSWLKKTTDDLKYRQLDIQQQALKLTANSIYGCLGFTNARFYAKPIAELITSQGREILQSTVDLVQNNLNLEVIYGDTDSIMIHTGLDDLAAAKAIGVKVIKEVNRKYRLLEIDMDGIFKRMLLLKKKKYAAVKVELSKDGSPREVMEQKGLDIVRRDWSSLSKEIGNFALEQILSEGSREDVVEAIHNQLRKLQEDMRNGQVELDKYIITKSLTKAPEDYPDAKNQPHVQVALRRRQAGHHVGCCAGDTVPYIICVDKDSTGLAERARHPDEIKANSEAFMVDIEYYLSQQIHPVVSRLCAPIEGTDARHIAECLGLDPSKFHRAEPANEVEDTLLSSATILDDDDRYRHCEALQLVCPQCTRRYQFSGVGRMVSPNLQDSSEHPVSDDPLRCPQCSHGGSMQRLSPAMLANQVKQRAEEFIARYYDGWMMCDDEACGHLTRNVSLRVVGDADRGTVCPNYPRCNGRLGRQYTEVDLYKQLTHFHRLLDAARVLDKVSDVTVKVAAERKLAIARPAFDCAAQVVKDLRDRCAYRWINMSGICVSVS